MNRLRCEKLKRPVTQIISVGIVGTTSVFDIKNCNWFSKQLIYQLTPLHRVGITMWLCIPVNYLISSCGYNVLTLLRKNNHLTKHTLSMMVLHRIRRMFIVSKMYDTLFYQITFRIGSVLILVGTWGRIYHDILLYC